MTMITSTNRIFTTFNFVAGDRNTQSYSFPLTVTRTNNPSLFLNLLKSSYNE